MSRLQKKTARANEENLKKIFTIPESEDSTLAKIEAEISRNIDGFLKEHVTAGDAEPAELETNFRDSLIPDQPVFVSQQADFLLRNVVAQSVHTSSPKFIGHMTSAIPYFMLPLAKIMVALNQNLVKIETSKAFTPLERQVIGMLHRLFYGFDESYYHQHTQDRNHSLGVLCSGGTIANITSLWVARNQRFAASPTFAGVKAEGFAAALAHSGMRGARFFVSRRGHYSLRKACDLLGLGSNALVSVPTDANYKMDLAELRKALEQAKHDNLAILGIIGIAGTTETGHIDPLEALADLAAEYQCHFHVDAAWGGPTLFSARHASLLKGIERADSITIDAHKQLYVTVGAGIAIFKDYKALNSIEQSAEYVIRHGSRDLGKHTLEGSRNGMALLIHSALRIIGKQGFALLIDKGISNCKRFAGKVSRTDDFELISAPELNLMTYRYVPPEARRILRENICDSTAINKVLNQLTIEIQRTQRIAGQTFVSRTTLQPKNYQYQNITVFRVVIANPLTEEKVFDDVLNEQRLYAKNILEGNIGKKLAKLCQGEVTDV